MGMSFHRIWSCALLTVSLVLCGCNVNWLISAERVPNNPIDITPPWLNFAPEDVYVDGTYAYVAGGVNGLHIFDITDPLNPVWVNRVLTAYEADGVVVSDGYAYVAGGSSTTGGALQVIAVDPPALAQVITTVEMPSDAYCVALLDGYAFVGEGAGLKVVDIDPPGAASIVASAYDVGRCFDVAVSNGYAYAVTDDGLQIIDVDPVESAHVVHSLWSEFDYWPSPRVNSVAVSGGFAYVGISLPSCMPPSDGNLHVVDITPPEAAEDLGSVHLSRAPRDPGISGAIAYVVTELALLPSTPPILSRHLFSMSSICLAHRTASPSRMALHTSRVSTPDFMSSTCHLQSPWSFSQHR